MGQMITIQKYIGEPFNETIEFDAKLVYVKGDVILFETNSGALGTCNIKDLKQK